MNTTQSMNKKLQKEKGEFERGEPKEVWDEWLRPGLRSPSPKNR